MDSTTTAMDSTTEMVTTEMVTTEMVTTEMVTEVADVFVYAVARDATDGSLLEGVEV